MNNIIKRTWDQSKLVSIEDLTGFAFQDESDGHTFEIGGVDGTGEPVSLTGTVSGVFRRPDNADVALVGSLEDGKAIVTLSEGCYAVPGAAALTVFVTSDDHKVAVYAAIIKVASTSSGVVAGETVQDVVDLINAIAAAVATIPASYSDLMAAVAPTFSTSAVYAVGSYVWYAGSLYRLKTTPITTAGSWNANLWQPVVLSKDVQSIKDTLDLNLSVNSVKDYALFSTPVGKLIENTWINTNGRDETYNGWASSDFIKFKDGHTVLGMYTTVKTDWVWFYDANKAPLSRATANVGFWYVSIPANAVFVRVSNTNVGMASLIIYDDNKTSMAVSSGYLDKGNLVQNTWIDGNGDEQTDTAWTASGYIEIPEAYTSLTISAADETHWCYFYDASKTPIEGLTVLRGTNTYELPTGAKYIRVSAKNADINSLKIYGDGALVDEMWRGFPSYYEAHVKSKAETISLLSANAPNGASFVFITDIHDKSNVMHSPALVKAICNRTGVSTVQLGGDYINSYPTRQAALERINRVCSLYRKAGVDTFIMLGNHEYNNPGASDTEAALAKELSLSQLKSVLRPIINKVVFDADSMAYYYDNASEKIRYFVGVVGRGTSETTASQAFIARELQNVPSGYGVVVFYHTILTLSNTTPKVAAIHPSAAALVSILEAAKSRTTVTIEGTTYDYTGAGFEVIGAFCGDYHLDMDYTTSGGVKIIATTCDSFAQQWSFSDTVDPRDTGTYEEQAFDVVTIDRTLKKIYMTRIGYGSDREFTYA